MDQGSRGSIPENVTSLGGKSWTAYISTFFLGLFLALIIGVVWSASMIAGIVALVISLAMMAYRILLLKSFHLFIDDNGVWVFSGILPWSKGVVGVKWRDLDEALYFQSMGSWLFKSYTIRIGHRFTKSSEILLSHWKHGDKAVTHINTYHQELVRGSSLN